MPDLRAVVEGLFRRESGRIIATLIRHSRSFDAAEEAMQDAFAAAMTRWPLDGLPQNPAAWIMAAATRRLIDYGRREQTRHRHQEQLAYETDARSPDLPSEDECIQASQLEDDRLRLIFTCCHPAINREAQIALTLRTLGGLSTAEIARAFLVPEPTMAQRLVRAKRKIQQARIPYQVPPRDMLPERLDAVRAVLYLIFNEGYLSTSGENLLRAELCAEAIRLARVLNELRPGDPENMGLLALMLLQDSRRSARCRAGELVPLEEQDRSLWDHAAIAEGTELVLQALGRRNPGPYQIQAAIGAVHGEAAKARDTDWKQIAGLYQALARYQPSPVVAMNYAVAVAMGFSLEKGLALLDEAGACDELREHYLSHAARADLLRRMDRREEALASYEKALSAATNEVERRFLRRRISELEPITASQPVWQNK